MEIRLFDNGQPWRQPFEAALQSADTALDLGFEIEVQHTAPLGAGLVLYFTGKSPAPQQTQDQLTSYLDAGNIVFPVLATAADAVHLPPQAATLNAFILDDYRKGWPEALVDQVLALVWQPRFARRIFISYKRSDSSAIALQLVDRLSHYKFDVFLDDCAIQYAADFQRELRWSLNDADLLVLLASEDYDQSKWVLEELNFANGAGVGILCARFPGLPGNHLPLHLSAVTADQIHQIDPVHLSVGAARMQRTLSDDGLDHLIRAIHQQRASALRRRLDDLLPLARARFQQAGAVVSNGPALGELRVDESGAIKHLRVLPYRATVDVVHQMYLRAVEESPPPAGVVCFFAENDPMHPRAHALNWAIDATRTGKPPASHQVSTYSGRVHT